MEARERERERDLAEMREQLRQSELHQQAAATLQLERDREATASAVGFLEGRQQAAAAEQALATTTEMRELANWLEAA
eukprot:6210685-Pyramimonas_sp.AAC.1